MIWLVVEFSLFYTFDNFFLPFIQSLLCSFLLFPKFSMLFIYAAVMFFYMDFDSAEIILVRLFKGYNKFNSALLLIFL